MSIKSIGENLLHFEAIGRGEPVIFVHGWPGSWRYWWATMQHLARHYRTLAVDLWGFGDSSKNPALYSLPGYVDLLKEFADGMGIARPCTLVGHGLGAVVALRFAEAHPALVRRVATVSLPVDGDCLDPRSARIEAESGREALRELAGDHPEVLSELHKADAVAVRLIYEQLQQSDLRRMLESLPVPVLLAFGEQDRLIVPSAEAYAFCAQPTSDRIAIPFAHCAHYVMLEDPARFNRLLLEFVRTAHADLADVAVRETWRRRTH